MSPAPSQSDGPIGDLAAPRPWPQPPRARWWQHRAVRVAAGVLVVVALLLVTPWTDRWRWHVAGSVYLELTAVGRSACVGLVLMPFMRRVSYRRRDILIVVLVPLYGQYVAAKMVSRLLALPRRDWPPRPDEADRVVRLPGDPGTYLLRPPGPAPGPGEPSLSGDAEARPRPPCPDRG